MYVYVQVISELIKTLVTKRAAFIIQMNSF